MKTQVARVAPDIELTFTYYILHIRMVGRRAIINRGRRSTDEVVAASVSSRHNSRYTVKVSYEVQY